MTLPAEAIVELLEALDELEPGADAEPIWRFLYRPKPRLFGLLADWKLYLGKNKPTKAEREEAGKLLEQITLVAFQGVRGAGVFKSYNTPGPQIDLLVDGSSIAWVALTRVLGLKFTGVLVEAKARKGVVDEQAFSRFCCIVDQNMARAVGVGIFFSLMGASGFGHKPKAPIGAARLRQVVHTARTGIPVVVFDAEEISTLDQPGSLLSLMQAKIRDAYALCGPKPAMIDAVHELPDLPPHLASVYEP